MTVLELRGELAEHSGVSVWIYLKSLQLMENFDGTAPFGAVY